MPVAEDDHGHSTTLLLSYTMMKLLMMKKLTPYKMNYQNSNRSGQRNNEHL